MVSSYAFVAVLATASFGMVVMEAPTQSPLEVWYKQTLEALEKGGKQLQETLGLPKVEGENEKLLLSLKNAANKVSETVAEYATKLQKDSKPYSEDVKKAVERVTKQWEETVKKLKDSETQAKLQNLQETLNTSLKKLADGANDLGKSMGIEVPEKVKKAASDVLEEVAKTAHRVQEKIAQYVADISKKKN